MDGHHEGCLHGAFHVVDRLEEMIKYEGYQVAPAELDAVLLTHDGLADAAVVGVRDGRGEEVPKASSYVRVPPPRSTRKRYGVRRRGAGAAEVSSGMGWFRA
ncbi:hypothetical protein [Pseudonocardia adelaidensis]|uniref:Uncharacterized protein n=1 Tax=Pseudonocardia adelaidensis TaxID=648754 RepID=A0ABP9P6E4_9PSEU